MDTGLQPFLGGLLHTLWAGLDHEVDIAVHRGPTEVHGDASYSGLHPVVSGYWSSVGQEIRVLVEGWRQQVVGPLSHQGCGCDGEAPMVVDPEGREPAGVLLFISRLSPELGLRWRLPIGYPLADM